MVAISFAAVLDQDWLGHAATGAGPDIGSLLAGFAWVGGLTLLCVTIGRRDRAMACAGLALFSTWGLGLVAAIVGSGIFEASFRIAKASDLATTDYGRIITIKVALVFAMVCLAIFNLRKRAGLSRGLAVSIALETTLGIGVLIAAATLGITAPPG